MTLNINGPFKSSCVNACFGDNVCVQQCNREYEENRVNCPCQENCPEGCPCPAYECPTGSQSSWVLPLNTYWKSNDFTTLIIDGFGRSKKINFSYDSKTEVSGSCSVVWHGKMYVFGGLVYNRQISMVEDCRLKLVGQLPFGMSLGACSQRDNEVIYICFENYNDPSTYKNCYESSGSLDSFSKLPSSSYQHKRTRVATTSGTKFMKFFVNLRL